MLVVTKSDLGRIADRALADLRAALRSLGAADTEVVAVSSVAPVRDRPSSVEALDRHRDGLDLPARRLRSRRMHALADFAAEHRRARACARSADAARPSGGSPIRSPGSTWPRWSGCSASRARRHDRAVSRIVLPAEPLVDGPTALRPWRDSDLQQHRAASARTRRSLAGRGSRSPSARPTARAYLLSRYDAIMSGVIGAVRDRRPPRTTRACSDRRPDLGSTGSTSAPRSATGWRVRPAAGATRPAPWA